MPALRRTITMLAAVATLAAVIPSSAGAIVGGRDAAEGQFPAIAAVTLGNLFSCTGTLIAPTWVLTAGHCGSLTAAGGVSSPVSWPAALIDVRLGSINAHNGGGEAVTVKQVFIPSQYLGFEDGYDISLLELSAPSAQTPIQIAGPGQTALWAPGVTQTVAGFGVTQEDGPSPSVLQVAEVPAISDPECAAHQPRFVALTMVCAGFPQGGIDTCQGDSGGPMFGVTAAGAVRVTGATSFGDGCARPNAPGVYARVGDAELRAFITTHVPAAIDNTPAVVASTVVASAPVSAKAQPAAKSKRASKASRAHKSKRSTCLAKASRKRTKRARAVARKRCLAAARKRS